MTTPSLDVAAILDRTARRYRQCDRFSRHYVASKLRRDPVHADVLGLAAREPFGDVVDVGCGRGQLGVALLEAGLARSVLGLERRPSSLAAARLAAGHLPFRGEALDLARDQAAAAVDTVLLIDVLYQLDDGVQAAVLDAVAGAARARIVIRTLDPARGARSRFTQALERMGRRVWPNAGSTVNAPTIAALTGKLEARGFAVEAMPCWRGTPFANVLLIARRVNAPPLPP